MAMRSALSLLSPNDAQEASLLVSKAFSDNPAYGMVFCQDKSKGQTDCI